MSTQNSAQSRGNAIRRTTRRIETKAPRSIVEASLSQANIIPNGMRQSHPSDPKRKDKMEAPIDKG